MMAIILGVLFYGGALFFAGFAGTFLIEGDRQNAIKWLFISVMLAGIGKGLRMLVGVTPPEPGRSTGPGWVSRGVGAVMLGLLAPICVWMGWQQWQHGLHWQTLILLGIAAIGVHQGLRLWRRGFTADDFT
jgi:hypothetical protein